MRRLNDTQSEIKTKQDLLDIIGLFKSGKPDVIFFDTETDGIHIKNSKPFLLQFGFVVNVNELHIFYVDREENPELFNQTVLTMFKLASKCEHLCGHNVKFDLHMLANLGYYYEGNNITDTMVRIRVAHDALTPENGGPPLGLKEYATMFIDRSAKLHEHELAAERQHIAKEYNVDLKNKLREVDKVWTMKYLDDYFKDVLHGVDTLPENVRDVYIKWYNNIPEAIRDNMYLGKVESTDIPYNILNRDTLKTYAGYDIVFTAEIYYLTKDAIEARHNEEQLQREEAVIVPCFHMERCGFQMNKDYIVNVTKDMAEYLKQQRTKLYNLIGREISVNANPTVKEILNTKYQLGVASTGKDALARLYDELKATQPDSDVVKFIGLVQELRTLEKWYATYLLRFIKEMKKGDRIYTQINQVGTVSGRVTSDFQQFPKYGINKDDGTPLFHPRNMIAVTPGYKGIAYLDYSQIELRLQALYTILVGNADLNLCRAYMPYKCVTESGEAFDYKNPEHIKHAYDWKWYYEEEPDKEWEATDVHAATTHVAFPDLDVHSDEFKKLRGKVGKRVNFAKNYGAQFNRIKVMFPDYDDETIHRIDDAYYQAFPGVKAYHEYCYEICKTAPYALNLFGVKYYGLSGHKLINCLVQGSGAYFLKEKICALDKYIIENNLKSRMQMQIHDEISFEIYPGEEEHVYKFKEIMQEFDGAYVPVIADLEFTTTTWGEKYECEEI
jgi:DNA polymerase-1